MPSVSDWLPQLSDATSAYGVPLAIASGVMQSESGGDPNAFSSAGAIGLMQLKPGTASDMGVNPWMPTENITGGVKYLAAMFGKFGNWRDALSAYRVGPNANPTHSDTGLAYADKILSSAGLGGNATTTQAGANLQNGGASSSTGPNSAPDKTTIFYVMAGLLIATLVVAGLFGLAKG